MGMCGVTGGRSSWYSVHGVKAKASGSLVKIAVARGRTAEQVKVA